MSQQRRPNQLHGRRAHPNGPSSSSSTRSARRGTCGWRRSPRSSARIASSDTTRAGHGSSSVPAGNYSIEQLGRDALAILDAEGARQAHICGISLGGLTAMWLGVHAPDRVSSLVLANTRRAHRHGAVVDRSHRARAGARHARRRRPGDADVVLSGLPSAARRTSWRASDRWSRRARRQATWAAARRCGTRICGRRSRRIRCPVLVVAGLTDVPTPPEALAFIHERIAGSKMLTLDAAHLSNVEQADAFTSAVMGFLGSL